MTVEERMKNAATRHVLGLVEQERACKKEEQAKLQAEQAETARALRRQQAKKLFDQFVIMEQRRLAKLSDEELKHERQLIEPPEDKPYKCRFAKDWSAPLPPPGQTAAADEPPGEAEPELESAWERGVARFLHGRPPLPTTPTDDGDAAA